MKDLRRKLKELRNENLVIEGTETNRAILFLNDILKRTSDLGERSGLYELLTAEYLRAGSPEKVLDVRRRHAEENPDDPLPWMSLATELSNHVELADQAILTSSKALEKAVKCNRFVRYVLGARARLAIYTKNPSLFNETIKSLISISTEKRETDIWFERDFIDDCQAGFACQSLVDVYLATCPRKEAM